VLTGSKLVPSNGSCSVPSPSFSFSALMAPNSSLSNAKSLREVAMARDMSHGENTFPDLVCSELVASKSLRNKPKNNNLQLETSFKVSSIPAVLKSEKTTRQTRRFGENGGLHVIEHCRKVPLWGFLQCPSMIAHTLRKAAHQ